MCVLIPEWGVREKQTIPIIPYDRTRDNGNRLSYRKFHLSITFSVSAGTGFSGRLWRLHP